MVKKEKLFICYLVRLILWGMWELNVDKQVKIVVRDLRKAVWCAMHSANLHAMKNRGTVWRFSATYLCYLHRMDVCGVVKRNMKKS